MGDQEQKGLLTVKEFAEAAGITPQAVYQRLDKSLQSYVVVLNGQKYLKSEALGAVSKQADSRQVEQDSSKIEREFNKVEQGLIETLKTTIGILQGQLATKDQQITELSKLLEQALTNTSQSHYIAAQAQKQISDGNTPTETERPPEAATAAQEPKKKGLFSRLFGTD